MVQGKGKGWVFAGAAAGKAGAESVGVAATVANAVRESGLTWADAGKDTEAGKAAWLDYRREFAGTYAASTEGLTEAGKAAIVAWSSKGVPNVTDADKEALKLAKAAAGTYWTRGFTKALGAKPAATDGGKAEPAEAEKAEEGAGVAAVLNPEQLALALASHYATGEDAEALAQFLLIMASNGKAQAAAAKAVAKIIK